MVETVLGGERYDFAGAVDLPLYLAQDLSAVVSGEISVRVLTDSLSLFHVVIWQSMVITEKTLMI